MSLESDRKNLVKLLDNNSKKDVTEFAGKLDDKYAHQKQFIRSLPVTWKRWHGNNIIDSRRSTTLTIPNSYKNNW